MPESYVTEAAIIMLGCQALDNVPPPAGKCPVCGSGIRAGDDDRYCSKCDSVSPAKQKRIDKALRVERIGVESKSKAEHAEARAKALLRAAQNRRPPLSEVERRRVWNGYRGGILRELASDLTNMARTGRDWLRLIGQEPNWSLVLDRRGNVIGTRDPGLLP